MISLSTQTHYYMHHDLLIQPSDISIQMERNRKKRRKPITLAGPAAAVLAAVAAVFLAGAGAAAFICSAKLGEADSFFVAASKAALLGDSSAISGTACRCISNVSHSSPGTMQTAQGMRPAPSRRQHYLSAQYGQGTTKCGSANICDLNQVLQLYYEVQALFSLDNCLLHRVSESL